MDITQYSSVDLGHLNSMNIENKKYFIYQRYALKSASMHHMIEILIHLIHCTVQGNVFQKDFAIIFMVAYNNDSNGINEYCWKELKI